jgi:NAD(P)-dependent dehydrogenase (short-subunit alcohol dehydrogenase family)
MVSIDLSGKTALVTGGGGVIAKGIGDCLGRAGAKVYITDINASTAEESAKTLRAGGINAESQVFDIVDRAQVEDAFERIAKKENGVDILVNAAGFLTSKPYMESTAEEFTKTLAVNLIGMDNCIRAALRHMLKNGYGKIVNISSVAGRGGAPLAAHYSSSKFGVLGLTQSVALAVAKNGITVNAVCPGTVLSPMIQVTGEGLAKEHNISVEEAIQMHINRSPMGIAQTPGDIGNAVLFLSCDLSVHITGIAINVCGGKRMD